MARCGIPKKATLQDEDHIARQDMDVPDAVFREIASRDTMSTSMSKGGKRVSMQHRLILKNIFVNAILVLSVSCTVFQVWAGDGNGSHPMELRGIMQNLGKNMQDVTDGISHEDWELVTKTAPLIADHPQPSFSERIRVLSFIGSAVSKYRGYDKQVHQAARELEQAAMKADGEMAIAAFARLQNSCLACHQRFRKPFVEHFYGEH